MLTELRTGRRDALDRLLPVVYEQLREIAHRRLVPRERTGTIETTALVHEAYLKLVDQSSAEWRDRAHFFAIASVAMRHVLIDRARMRAASKRGGENERVSFDDDAVSADVRGFALLEIDAALDRLADIEPRLARVFECRFFG